MRIGLPRAASGPTLERTAAVILAVVALAWCVIRFAGLERAPAGASTDEALSGLHVQCFAETRASADGHRWPMFLKGLGGGGYTPAYFYSLFLWTRLFGISMTSIRAFSVFVSMLAMVGIALLTRLLAGSRAAFLAVVAAALSPWSFQLSRFGVDNPLAPTLLVWGVYCFLRSPRLGWAAAGGVLLSLAAYTYPPVRVQVALLTPFLLYLQRRTLGWARTGVFLGSLGIVSIPLVVRILDGTLVGRARALSIFTRDYIDANRGPLSPLAFLVKQIFENMFEHLRPSYLFFTGDPNIRHSTQIMGELGWLDILAVGCLAAAVTTLLARVYRRAPIPQAPPSRNWLVAAGALVGAAFAVVPAALCWEGLPHSLRSITGWTAVALFTGAVLDVGWSRWKLIPVLAAGLAVAQTIHFVPYYFRHYPRASYNEWDGELRDAAASRDRRRFAAVARRYDPLGYRYYLVRYFGASCASSQEQAKLIAAGRW